MTKYKWALLGLILSIILFIIFLISPLITLIDVYKNPLTKYIENLDEKAFIDFSKSFYNWNLFWIPIIIFSFMVFNYKKANK